MLRKEVPVKDLQEKADPERQNSGNLRKLVMVNKNEHQKTSKLILN